MRFESAPGYFSHHVDGSDDVVFGDVFLMLEDWGEFAFPSVEGEKPPSHSVAILVFLENGEIKRPRFEMDIQERCIAVVFVGAVDEVSILIDVDTKIIERTAECAAFFSQNKSGENVAIVGRSPCSHKSLRLGPLFTGLVQALACKGSAR